MPWFAQAGPAAIRLPRMSYTAEAAGEPACRDPGRPNITARDVEPGIAVRGVSCVSNEASAPASQVRPSAESLPLYDTWYVAPGPRTAHKRRAVRA